MGSAGMFVKLIRQVIPCQKRTKKPNRRLVQWQYPTCTHRRPHPQTWLSTCCKGTVEFVNINLKKTMCCMVHFRHQDIQTLACLVVGIAKKKKLVSN